MSTGAVTAPALTAPTKLDDLGVRRSLLEALGLKIVYLRGEISVQELAEWMKVSRSVADELFQRLRKEQLCEVTGMTGPVYHIQTTSRGRERALELLTLNQYAGPAPVSLDDYVAQVRSQSVRRLQVHPANLNRAFAHLVLDKEILNQLGTAMTSGRAIFLYGPTGTGKTTLAETLTEVFFNELVWLPYAIEVDGQIITVFDPHVHREELQISPGTDTRWVRCHRPRVVVGGELQIESLNLQFNPLTRFYTGPVQLKANSGVLIIDDFGRQRVAPAELLNRWVVPLDRQIDFLTMAGGKQVEIPFDMFVVFATNLDISQLVDEAFLRRVQTKIYVDFVREEQFRRIFENVCNELGLSYAADIAEYTIQLITQIYHQPLRACYPRDVANQVCWAAKYEAKEPKLDRPSVEQACANYFIRSSAH